MDLRRIEVVKFRPTERAVFVKISVTKELKGLLHASSFHSLLGEDGPLEAPEEEYRLCCHQAGMPWSTSSIQYTIEATRDIIGRVLHAFGLVSLGVPYDTHDVRLGSNRFKRIEEYAKTLGCYPGSTDAKPLEVKKFQAPKGATEVKVVGNANLKGLLVAVPFHEVLLNATPIRSQQDEYRVLCYERHRWSRPAQGDETRSALNCVIETVGLIAAGLRQDDARNLLVGPEHFARVKAYTTSLWNTAVQ